MFKKNLPFALFLTFLIALMAFACGGLTLLSKQDRRNADRMLFLLSQGKVEEANCVLASIYFFWKLEIGTTFQPAFRKSLAACLGEMEIAIKDSADARRYLQKIEPWPQPLKTWTKLELRQSAWNSIALKGFYKQKINVILKLDRSEKRADRALFEGPYHLDMLEPILIGIPLSTSAVQFVLVGPILLIVLLWEWRLEKKHPSLGEIFSSFTLSEPKKYLVLGVYLLALALANSSTLLVLQGYSGPGYLIYLICLVTCLVFVLPLTLPALLRRDMRRIRNVNDVAERPQPAVILHSLLRQYKFFLWRLWPVWLLSGLAAGLLLKLYWGYQLDLYGCMGW